VLHQRISQRRWTFDKSEVPLPLPSNAASFLRWRVSPFNDESSHLLRDCTKFPHYYVLHHVTKAWFTLCHSPLYRTEDKFCNSYIQQQCTLQHTFHINVELHVPQIFYQLPYVPNSEKYNKRCTVCHVGGEGWGPLCISQTSHCFQMLQPWLLQHGTLIYHSQPAQTNVL